MKTSGLSSAAAFFLAASHVGQPMDPEMAPLVLLRPDERVELRKALRSQIELGRAGSLVWWKYGRFRRLLGLGNFRRLLRQRLRCEQA